VCTGEYLDPQSEGAQVHGTGTLAPTAESLAAVAALPGPADAQPRSCGMSSTRKRLTIALGGAAALGLAVASAASLGPLSSKSLGAGDTIVQSYDKDGLAVDYTNAYDNATGKYRTTAVTITG